jgi:hypothetical protein
MSSGRKISRFAFQIIYVPSFGLQFRNWLRLVLFCLSGKACPLPDFDGSHFDFGVTTFLNLVRYRGARYYLSDPTSTYFITFL